VVSAAAISWLSFDRQACNAAIPLRPVRPTGRAVGDVLQRDPVFWEVAAMLDYSALALNHEGSDPGGPLKYGRLRRKPDAGQ